MTDLTDFIVEQLNAKGMIVFGADGNQENLKTYCFEGHDSKTPSLSIRRWDGAFLCFGCHVKGPNWNALAAHINADQLSDEAMPDPFLLLNKKLEKRIQKAAAEVKVPWDVEPWTKAFRHVPLSTLQKLSALRWYDDTNPKDRCERVLFPVSMYGEIEGWVARRTDKAPPGQKLDTPYRNAKHMSSAEALYPLDHVIGMKRRVVVLVEGPYDAIRLVNYGIPALSILGTGNYHPDNRMHILNAGARAVILAMDADEAGETARLDIAPSIREMFDLKHFVCPDGKDPGNMPKAYMDRLWRMVREIEKNYPEERFSISGSSR
jgi:DNA primase